MTGTIIHPFGFVAHQDSPIHWWMVYSVVDPIDPEEYEEPSEEELQEAYEAYEAEQETLRQMLEENEK